MRRHNFDSEYIPQFEDCYSPSDTVPSAYIDLNEVAVTGVVPSDLQAADLSYNDLNADEVFGYVRDKVDAQSHLNRLSLKFKEEKDKSSNSVVVSSDEVKSD